MRSFDLLRHLHSILESVNNIVEHAPKCPDPVSGGCIPSNTCIHENSHWAQEQLERLIKKIERNG